MRWELDGETYEVKRVWYGRTVIRSSYKLSYETAQALLDGGAAAQEVTIPELAAFDDGTRQVPAAPPHSPCSRSDVAVLSYPVIKYVLTTAAGF